MRRTKGFTLLEMMVVIIIVVILASVSVALLNVFFRGQGVRQGAMIVTNAVAQAKQKAAEKHRYFFLVFSPIGKDGWMEVHEDKNEDGIYQGDDKADTVDADPAVEGGKVDLPKFVVFDQSPSWIAFSPSGYCHFNPGFKEIQASSFDKVMNGSNPTPLGDVILRIQGRGFVMCIDLDKAAGKVRRFFFINEEIN
jgi:prepilin-type N-terminal cleavage/methylation domain-containing protein